MTRSFDVVFDLRLNKRLSKQSWGWWFETPSRSLWRHCNEKQINVLWKFLWPSIIRIRVTLSIILGRNCIYFTWVAASHRGEARGLWINASPRERSLVKFHLSESRIWNGFSPWGNRGSVACHLLRMKTSATYPQPQVASQHLDGAWTRRPSPLPTAMLVWYGEQPRGITPLAESRERTQDLPRGKPVTYH